MYKNIKSIKWTNKHLNDDFQMKAFPKKQSKNKIHSLSFKL